MPEHDRRRKRRVDLVFEGGGVKGIALAGAAAVLAEHGYEPVNLAGSSAGAIVAALLAAGYGPEDLQRELLGLDYRSLLDRGWEDRVPVAGRALSLLLDQGLHEGERLQDWLAERLAAHNVRCFGDLVLEEFAADERYRHRLQVIASDVTAHRLLVLPRDARALGLDPDRMSVALAVRMSAAIPVVFEPVRVRVGAGRGEHLVVDGGMLSNFPVWLFDCDGVPPWPTFGLLLVEPGPGDGPARLPLPDPGVRRLVGYLRGLVRTMMEAHDRREIEDADFARTIPIPTLGIGSLDFDLGPESALALYRSGRAAAERFLASWDFDAYVSGFRAGTGAPARHALMTRRRARAARG